jgi:hypothetical protein
MMRRAETLKSYDCAWSEKWAEYHYSQPVRVFIRNPSEFVRLTVPKFFKGGLKFASFKQKLHRWGFRVIMHMRANKAIGQGYAVLIFRNENFQIDRAELMQDLRSATVPVTRKEKDGSARRSSHGMEKLMAEERRLQAAYYMREASQGNDVMKRNDEQEEN